MSSGSGRFSANYLSASERARAQMRAVTGERSLPRQFCFVHILFRNLNSASTGNVWAIESSGTSKGLRTTDAFVMKSNIRVPWNIRIRTRVWLPEPLSRSANRMETLDDQIHIPWPGLISLSGDCNSGTRASSYPGAGRVRLSLSQR